MSLPTQDGRKRVVIEAVTPTVDAGRFPVKRTRGDLVRVEADIFTDGHDAMAASLLAQREGAKEWVEIPMQAIVDGNDRWTGSFRVSSIGRYTFKVQAWIDHFETWRRDLLKRIAAETDTSLDYLIGADLVDAAAERASGPDALWLSDHAALLRHTADPAKLRDHATEPRLLEHVLRHPDKRFASQSDHDYTIVVDPVIARFSSWYEFFPRSTASEPGKHGTFADAETRLPYVADMGFSVV
jgi:starch synthase (maltosyl-transferring)